MGNGRNVMKCSLVIPVFNEIDAFEDLEKNITECCTSKDFNGWEVIVVDDGSIDGTKERLLGLASKLKSPVLTMISHKQNRGYGSALKTGIVHSKSEYIAIIDADGTYPIECLPKMYEMAKDYVMVVGKRIPTNNSIPFHKELVKKLIRVFSNYMVGENVGDFNSGQRVFQKNLAVALIEYFPNGFSFTTTITLACSAFSLPVFIFEIPYRNRLGKSKIRPIKDTINFFKVVAKIGIYFNPSKVFTPLVLTFGILSILSLLLRYFYDTGALASTIFIMLAFFMSILGAILSKGVSMVLKNSLNPETIMKGKK
jgi:glycosyltransferase involved in cell wall biosynthesis